MRERLFFPNTLCPAAILLGISLVTGCSSSSNVKSVPRTEAEIVAAVYQRVSTFLEQCVNGCGLSLDPGSAVDSVFFDDTGTRITIEFNDSFAQIPFREGNVAAIRQLIPEYLGENFESFEIDVRAGNILLAELIPNIYRSDVGSIDSSRRPRMTTPAQTPPHVINISRPVAPISGLQGRHIAIWPSHGWYFEARENRWEWQRARLFQTVEDILPMSFVARYLAPMLERAGARVYLPRERDPQYNEAIVDNDGESVMSRGKYLESDNLAPAYRRWATGINPGFAGGDGMLRGADNPFLKGTYRLITTDSVTTASAAWIPDIPENGDYAVYVSYAKLANAASDARYTVHHLGGETTFLVNQTMGSATWTYLDTFRFGRGVDSEVGMVTLENESSEPGKLISGDAVRFGGGRGNVIRGSAASGRPRFTEAARYYMQFSGMPDTLVYNVTGTLNDYVDDYRGRAEWVNFLRGAPSGPNKERSHSGLGIPIDVSLAFHTDAGIADDRTIGTLMIYSSEGYEAERSFPDGMSRLANRDLGDIMQTQIVDDLRVLYDSTWSRRSIWDRDYSEAVRPNVPGILLELLSHQNFTDMKFALDPAFRSDVSRSVYKALLRFISFQYGLPYTVQPLPVRALAIGEVSSESFVLTWQPRSDPLEPTAEPTGYVVYRRRGDSGFDTGVYTNDNTMSFKALDPGVVYSFRVAATNEGGESATSEVVSMGIPEMSFAASTGGDGETKRMLVINGFDRISAPGTVDYGAFKGFSSLVDEGVADGWDVSFVGNQYDYDTSSPYLDDDAPGHGASYATFETWPRVGNTFDYAAIHGRAILSSGVAFVTASNEAVAGGDILLGAFDMVDVILGEQKRMEQAGNRRAPQYEVFSDDLKVALRRYAVNGGRLFVSGAHVGSDLHGTYSSDSDRTFSSEVLHMKFQTDHASETGRVVSPNDILLPLGTELNFNVDPSASVYRVESPDAILPQTDEGEVLLRYAESNSSAAIGFRGTGASVVFGFPFETITGDVSRAAIMSSIIHYLFR